MTAPIGTAALSAKQQRLLELLERKRQRQKEADRQARAAIAPRPEGAPPMLSFSQRRLWFIEQLEPGTSAYHVPGAVRIRGPLDVDLLQRALDAVVERHETLRLAVREDGGEPQAVLDPDARLPLLHEDLTDRPPAAREDELRRRIDAHLHRPFDLTEAPLARVVLLKVDDDHHVFFLLLHHLISDVWSIGVFFRNVTALYDGWTRDVEDPLPPLPLQYSDYAAWQTERLSGDNLERLRRFWRDELGGAPAVLELATDHPRPPQQTFKGGQAYLTLDVDTTEALRALATEHEASLYMVLFAALNTLLFRYSGQETILIGLPIANRNRVELEGLVGLLLDSLVVRSDLRRDMTFRDLVRSTRERMLGSFAHQELPFDRVVETLDIERDMSRNPLYQVMFTFQNVPGAAMDTSTLKMSRYEVLEGTSRDDLELNLRETDDGLAGWFTYDVGLYDQTTAERLARQLVVLLRAAVADPNRPLGLLPLLPPAERHMVLHEWVDTAVADAPGDDFLTRFVERVAAVPGEIAAEDDTGTVTYEALWRRAASWGAALARRGVGPGDTVALLDERGLDFLTAVLAVFHAGAAYLPLDPHHPEERHRQVLERSRSPWAVVAAQRRDGLEAAGGTLDAPPRLVTPAELDTEAGEAGESDGAIPAPVSVAPTEAAYTIFTSGSTGLPKGATVQRAGMLNHLRSKLEELRMSASDVVAQTASQCFDISVWQFLAPLMLGGRVRIYADEVAHDPMRLLEAVESDGVTILETVPSILRLWLDEMDHRGTRAGDAAPGLGALRWLVPTGEALPPDLANRWLDRYPDIPLVNAYGPTECSDDVTHHRVSEPLPPGTARVPIGRPIRNTRQVVVDRALRPVPMAVPGELVVSGVAVGSGYLNDPSRTAQVFVPDPFSGACGARLYRTGDLVRWRPDGALGFFGRLDHQVKLRGFRIELGEIEAALESHAGVDQALVMVRETAAEPLLLAYVAVASGLAETGNDPEDLPDELRRDLAERLPEYMVPAGFVVLDAFPLTSNGKVDRKALARLDDPDMASDGPEYQAPRTPVEESLAAVWQAVLHRDRVGRNDDFFAIGGQSLLATQVASRLREAFGVELPVRAVFQRPVLADLAAEVELEMARSHNLPDVPPLVALPAEQERPLSFAQERLWFIDQMMPGLNAYNIFGAVRMRGRLDHDVLERSFGELLRRHQVLRTTFDADGGQARPVVAEPRGRISIPVVDLTGLAEETRYDLAVALSNEVSQRLFDLHRGPLLRAHAMRLADDDHLMAVTAHHIVYDVWSREILIRELGVLYEALWHGRPSPLPELDVQYSDFAHWQRRWKAAGGMDAQTAYWVERLQGVTSGTELPGDRPRPSAQSFEGARVYFSLTEAATRAVNGLARRHGVTPFMTLLAGFKTLLHRHTGDTDVVLGTPIANRNRAEVEAMIGFFVNTQVLRTDLTGDPAFAEVLDRVRETALGAYSHQDLAFEELVKELRPPRDASRQPLFQILFNFLPNYDPIVMDLPELRLTPEITHSGAVQFDLVVTLYEIDGVLQGSADYATDLYDRTTVERLLRGYARLLDSAAATPEAPVSALAVLPDSQRHQVLWEWNDTDRAAEPQDQGEPDFEPVHDRVLRLAARTPEAPALRMGDRVVSYGDLAARAEALAAHLVARGLAGPERAVGIHLPRSPEAVVTLLGVLRARGAYVALDPDYPAERLRFQVEDCGAKAVVTHRALAGRLPLPAGVEELLLEDLEATAPPASPISNARLARTAPQNLAYLLYTSGSTGRPKGVAVTHGGLAASTEARRAVYGAVERYLLLPSLAFDSSVAGLFGTLGTGGCLVLPPSEVQEDPSRLGELLEAQEVTHLLCVPSLYGVILEQLRDPALRTVVVAGEACPPDLVERHHRRLPGVPLLNEYGPTEGTVWSTVQRLEPGRTVSIGRPIRGVRAHVVDRRLRLAPPGTAGELALAGAGLARGYRGRPAATAAAFVPDPFATEPGARLYRTGDLARHRADGELLFLGRLDHQVKVRGFRIELEEIESALADHDAVSEAVVVAVEGPDGGGLQRLVAYWTPTPSGAAATSADLSGDALRESLRDRLPGYMLPSAVVRADELPRTPNGKVDRRRLREAAGEELGSKVPYEAPRTELEEELAEIWRELLRVERVGVRDSFFDLGGHSLLTTQLASRLRDRFRVEIPLQSFFEDPTVGALAQGIEVARWVRDDGPPMDDSDEEFEEGAL